MNVLNRYLFAFFMFGQSTFIPWNLRFRSFLRWIPLICHTFITIVCSRVICGHSFMKIKRIGSSYGLFTAAVLLSSIFPILSNVFFWNSAGKIVQLCVNSMKQLERRFGARADWNFLLKTFIRMAILSFCMFTIFLIVRFTVTTSVFNTKFDLAFCTMHFFRFAFINYFVFHMALFNSVSEFLNINLKQMRDSKRLNKIQMYDLLLYVTRFHHRLWGIARAIDNRFGWTILAVLFDLFVNIMNMAYWIFWYLDSYNGRLTAVIRKYH